MTPLRIFRDEDVYTRIAVVLRNKGIDATSTLEAGRGGESDNSQLTWASNESRTIVTFNVAHFAQLHQEWLTNDKHHAGIIVSAQLTFKEVLARLLKIVDSLDGESMQDRLEFLSNW